PSPESSAALQPAPGLALAARTCPVRTPDHGGVLTCLSPLPVLRAVPCRRLPCPCRAPPAPPGPSARPLSSPTSGSPERWLAGRVRKPYCSLCWSRSMSRHLFCFQLREAYAPHVPYYRASSVSSPNVPSPPASS
ncbi:hypothetical protein HispidOSU_027639, partial [Sigmodon hispidus]